MSNPYASKQPHHFWRSGVADVRLDELLPVPAKRFTIARDAPVATAGSCFSQRVAEHLRTMAEFRFLEAEERTADQPSFSALYGNIYTVRHLLQLLRRSVGAFVPAEAHRAWQRADGRWVDPFRPSVFPAGFASPQEVERARTAHLAAVRRLFSECAVFLFTMGLTEAWVSPLDGAVFPLAPGVVAPSSAGGAVFHNFTYAEVLADLQAFLAEVRALNERLRVILTVSPVPITATWGEDHVLVASTRTKSILRAVSSAIEDEHPHVYYFPAYDVVTGPASKGAYYNDNLRTITPAGIAQVMRLFRLTYGEVPETVSATPAPPAIVAQDDDDVLCDDEEIVKTIGFGK